MSYVRRDADVKRLPKEPWKILGNFADRAYLGVPFLRRYVIARAKATDGWGSLLDDAEHGDPLLECGGGGAVRRRL